MANAIARRRFCTMVAISRPPPPAAPPPGLQQGIPAANLVLDFGEYKGMAMGSLPSGYLGYIAENFKFKDDLKSIWAKRAQEILDARHARRQSQEQMRRELVTVVENSTREATVAHILTQLECQTVPDPTLVYGLLIRRCIQSKSLQDGELLHEHILKSGSGKNRFLGNLLIQMYGKCGDVNRARAMFDSIPNRNDRTYGIMMTIYVQRSKPLQVLKLWEEMEADGVSADAYIVTNVLAACTSLRALEQGRAIHEHLVISGFKTDKVLETTLLKFYSTCGSIEDFRRVFEGMHRKDQHCWSSMIAALTHNDRCHEALVYYRRMVSEGFEPNAVTYSTALKACSRMGSLEEGRAIHNRIRMTNLHQDKVLRDALLGMYLRCGDLKEARKVFDAMGESRNVISWTFLMASYVQTGNHREALKLYAKMSQEVEPNALTFATVLTACSELGDLETGRRVHSRIRESAFQPDFTVLNALVTMYCKCGCSEEAWKVFENLKREDRNVNMWNKMISTFANHGCPHQALQIFKSMNVEPNSVTISGVLDACGRLGALEQGRRIHQKILEEGRCDELLRDSLVGMYANCGSFEDAEGVGYDRLKRKSTNIFLETYALHGCRDKVVELYREAVQEGVKLDRMSFVHILTSFANNPTTEVSGFEDCKAYFQIAIRDHLITPGLEHYLSVVRTLCRAKMLENAEELVENMPHEDAMSPWMILLRACNFHGDFKRGRRIAEKLIKLTPGEVAPYLELSRLYTDFGNDEDAAAVTKLLNERGIKQHEFSTSFVEGPDDEVRKFTTEHQDGVETPEVRKLLLGLLQTKEPDNGQATDESIPFLHSELLAIGYGLLTNGEEDDDEDGEIGDGDKVEKPGKRVLRVVTNRRMSSESHEAVKLISDIVEEKLVVRDQSRFHTFEKGMCSCGDFW